MIKTATQVVVDCNGVGYDVQISLNTYADIEPKSSGMLFTYHLVREDAQMLFGFSTEREKSLFELLISVSGVGANTARVILSSLSPSEVEQAILSEDSVTLQGVKGIGAKTAQRIVIDLKDKVGKIAMIADASGLSVKGSSRSEAHSALTTLVWNILPKMRLRYVIWRRFRFQCLFLKEQMGKNISIIKNYTTLLKR